MKKRYQLQWLFAFFCTTAIFNNASAQWKAVWYENVCTGTHYDLTSDATRAHIQTDAPIYSKVYNNRQAYNLLCKSKIDKSTRDSLNITNQSLVFYKQFDTPLICSRLTTNICLSLYQRNLQGYALFVHEKKAIDGFVIKSYFLMLIINYLQNINFLQKPLTI